MATRADFGVLPQPFRWLAHPAAWLALAAAAVWLKSRPAKRFDMSAVSSDWLLNHERQSTRNRDL